MKTFISLSIAALLLTTAACKKDNYDPPKSTLSGRIVYQGQPVGVRTPQTNSVSSVTTGGVQLELWQHSYDLFTKIPVYINQDGSFSAILFDGDYKLVRMNGGPWENNTDSIDIKVSGNQTIDVPVVPFFTVNTPNFTFNKSDTTLTATFTATQVSAGKTIEAASISVGRTQFVDIINCIYTRDGAAVAGSPTTMTIQLNPNRYTGTDNEQLRQKLSTLLAEQSGYARIGIKTTGVAERVYSTVQNIGLK